MASTTFDLPVHSHRPDSNTQSFSLPPWRSCSCEGNIMTSPVIFFQGLPCGSFWVLLFVLCRIAVEA